MSLTSQGLLQESGPEARVCHCKARTGWSSWEYRLHTRMPDMMLTHSLRKMTNSYFAMKKILDRPTTPHRIKSVLFDSYISSKWQWCSSVVWPSVRALKSIEGLKNSLLLGVFRFCRDPFSTWLENVKGCRRALNLYCQRFEGPNWQVSWLTRLWSYFGHLARSQEGTPLTHLLRNLSSHKLGTGALRPAWLAETPFHKFRLVYQRIRLPEEHTNWEWQATDRTAWKAMLPRWLQYWKVVTTLPLSTEYLAGRQLVVADQGFAALRPRRNAWDGVYTRGLLHLRRWRANSRTARTFWVTHLPESPTACIYSFQKGVEAHAATVLHLRLKAGRNQDPGPLPILLTLCELLKLHDEVFPLQTATVVLPPHTLPKYILEGVTDSRDADAARFTRMMTVPKKLPERWALQLGFVPSGLPDGWDYMFRTADFHHAQYFVGLRSALMVMLKPQLMSSLT